MQPEDLIREMHGDIKVLVKQGEVRNGRLEKIEQHQEKHETEVDKRLGQLETWQIRVIAVGGTLIAVSPLTIQEIRQGIWAALGG